MVGAPYAGVGGYQRGAALALDSEMETGRVYTVPGDLSWMPASEGTQVKKKSPFLSFVRITRGQLPPSTSSLQHLELD